MNTFRTHRLAAAAALALTLALGGHAQAQVVNGSFDTDLSGWATLGHASQQAGVLLLDNADTVADASALAWAAGLADVAVLDLNGSAAYEGSLASQTFNAVAGQQLSFSWQFASDETDPSPQFQDYAFLVLDGVFTRLGGVGDAPAAAQTFSLQGLAAGSHQLAFGVVDLGDYTVDSRLLVDNVQLSTAVPEPGSMALMLAGLTALGLRARRHQRAR